MICSSVVSFSSAFCTPSPLHECTESFWKKMYFNGKIENKRIIKVTTLLTLHLSLKTHVPCSTFNASLPSCPKTYTLFPAFCPSAGCVTPELGPRFWQRAIVLLLFTLLQYDVMLRCTALDWWLLCSHKLLWMLRHVAQGNDTTWKAASMTSVSRMMSKSREVSIFVWTSVFWLM